MPDDHDKEMQDKRPHGETGDTVQQAAEVSKPTSTVGRAIDSERVPQAPVDRKTAGNGRDDGDAAHRNTAGTAAP